MPLRFPERGPAVHVPAGGRTIVRCGVCGFIGVAAGLFSGCGTTLRQSFNNYSDVYTETQNRQMLLNLARLHEREPAFFFQLTQITSSYTFNESLGLSDLKSVGLPASTTANLHTASGNLGETATHNPIFTLIPLAGDKFAQQMLAPIKPQVFYELFEEGWPLDLLMRVLIERIELEELPAKSDNLNVPPSPADGLIILENHPYQWTDGNASDKANVVQDGPKGHFDRFLRACALAREFQEHGLIYLAEEKSFQPVASVSLNAPDAKSIESAVKNGLTWKLLEEENPGSDKNGVATTENGSKVAMQRGWQLGKASTKTFFRLASDPNGDPKHPTPAKTTQALMDALKGKPCYQGCDQPVDTFADVVMKGFDVTDDTSKRLSIEKNVNGQSKMVVVQVRLVMRSLMGAMTALASEQDRFSFFSAGFAEQQRKHQARWQNHSNPEASDNWAPLPDFENHPVLELIPTEKSALGLPVVQLDYKGKHYEIADPIPLEGSPPLTWNRDVFRLLVQLSFLATADPSAFASTSLIQLH